MGAIKEVLVKKKLKDRELHNSRLFVDLCENIHIHFREYRFVFSLDEFFEFTDILQKSLKDINAYLIQNPEYREGRFPDAVIIAGGRDRQMKQLQNSPQPHTSKYYNNDFSIELQEDYVVDEIHIHYRDFRLVLDRGRFKELADGFTQAKNKLIEFESLHGYERKRHPDREIIDENRKDLKPETIVGSEEVAIERIKSKYFKDIYKDWPADRDYINHLKRKITSKEFIPPIPVCKENDGFYYIVMGHHRYLAYLESGFKQISCVVIPGNFFQTEKLRKCEVLLKELDRETNYEYNFSSFWNDYIAFKFNRHYRGHFKRKQIEFLIRNILSRNTKIFIKALLGKIKSRALKIKS